MVTKVVIRDNKHAPIGYLPKLDNFKDGTEFNFYPGVNVIVGENGSGKTTLLNLIKRYLMVDRMECGRGIYNININYLRDFNGVDVYADYTKNTFRLIHADESTSDDKLANIESFSAAFEQMNSSTGESVVIAINSLLRHMFSPKTKLTFDYSQFKDSHPEYYDYVESHRVDCADEFTILMDEPDRNLSIDNIGHIKDILSFHKERTQIISVVHNPLIIYYLSGISSVNIIEMTEGYVDKVRQVVEDIKS